MSSSVTFGSGMPGDFKMVVKKAVRWVMSTRTPPTHIIGAVDPIDIVKNTQSEINVAIKHIERGTCGPNVISGLPSES